jgi:cation diffusion facilitator family transporter
MALNMENKTEEKNTYVRKAAIISVAGNAVLAVTKIVAGIISNSGALLGDGIDSSTDVLISIVTLAVVGIISKPADAEHPWGHRRAETVTTAFLSFVIFFAGAQLIFKSVTNLFSGGRVFEFSIIAFAATFLSITGKTLLAWSQYALGKRAGSDMIKANAKNMTSDVLISLSVLLGLLVSTLSHSSYADSVIAILIGVWVIRTAVGIFLEANLELMDGNTNTEPYHVILEAVNATEGASNPHRARMRRIAGFWDISFDVDVSPDITISQGHSIASHVENEIKKRLENVFDIMVHVEPKGDQSEETFGLSEDEMRADKEDRISDRALSEKRADPNR